MKRVASLYLPALSIERLQRSEPLPAPPKLQSIALRAGRTQSGSNGPALASGGWRPGARWARDDKGDQAFPAETASSAEPQSQTSQVRAPVARSEPYAYPFKRREHRRPAVLNSSISLTRSRTAPLILAEQAGNRQLVAAASLAALALGLRPGMAVTHARALVTTLDVRPANPAADLVLLERLTHHAIRHWAPTAAVSGSDGLWLDLTGVTHLHGGEDHFCVKVLSFCRRLGLTARIGVAGTPGAAHALARFGRTSIEQIENGAEAQALSSRPLACLRLPSNALTCAARFGLETVGDLLLQPRGPLTRRLGHATLRRLDEALGRIAEPIVPLVQAETPTAIRHLLEPIGTAPAIQQVISDLLADLVQRLRERGLGARTVLLRVVCVDGSDQHFTVGTVRSTRDPAHLGRLFQLRIEHIEPGEGIECMQLTAPRTEPLDTAALALGLDSACGKADLAELIDQLAGRVGSQALFTIGAVESDVPERACARLAPLDTPPGWPRWKRPARLLRHPEPLSNVIALLPDNPPRRFVWRGSTHTVVAGDGPERIHGEWWRRDGEVWGCRDYFRVENEAGARFWVFRRGDGVDDATGDRSWYLHGLFG